MSARAMRDAECGMRHDGVTHQSPVCLSTMENAIHRDAPGAIIDGKQHAIIADPESIAIAPDQLFDLRSSRFGCQLSDAMQERAPLVGVDPADILCDSLIVDEIVHWLDEPLMLQAPHQLGMANQATACAYGAIQDRGISPIFSQPQQPSVVRQRKDHGFGLAAAVNEEPAGFEFDSHGGDLLVSSKLSVGFPNEYQRLFQISPRLNQRAPLRIDARNLFNIADRPSPTLFVDSGELSEHDVLLVVEASDDNVARALGGVNADSSKSLNFLTTLDIVAQKMVWLNSLSSEMRLEWSVGCSSFLVMGRASA